MHSDVKAANVMRQVGGRIVLDYKKLRSGLEQYTKNLNMARGFLGHTEEALGSTGDVMRSAYELAKRLELGDKFWQGDMDAGYEHELAPSGISLERLKASPGGITVAAPPRYQKFLPRRRCRQTARFQHTGQESRDLFA